MLFKRLQIILYPKSLLLWVVLATMICTIQSHAQLKVAPNTVFTVKNTLSSKEQLNTFESSVQGEGKLSLVGKAQKLSVASKQTLHTLHILHADQTSIETNIQLNGNLIVSNGTLHLKHQVTLLGNLYLLHNATIINQQLINRLHAEPLALQTQNNFKNFYQNAVFAATAIQALLPNKQQQPTHFADLFMQELLANQPPKPPPQKREQYT